MSLTEDDKKWLAGLMEPFATKLQEFAANQQGFATKLQEFAANQQGFQTHLDRIETKLEQFATKAELERVETSLLTEFHKWAAPSEARQRTHTATLHAIDLEMEVLSERIQKLEGPGAS